MRSTRSNARSHSVARTVRLVAAAVGICGAAAAGAASDEPGQFRAACVKVDITPDTPQWMQGYGPRQSTGVHDRIYHRIAAMDDGRTTFYLVSTDICTILPSFYHEFCDRLARETQIRPEHIWWSTTHTHSAPHVGPQDLGKLFMGTLGDRFSIKHDTDYWAAVADKLVTGVNEARSRLEPARLGIVSSTAAANVNRRQRRADGRIVLGVNPEGPVDRQLGLLRLERRDGTLIGLIANYAVHGTALGGGNTLISGDVPGFAAQYVERSTGVPLLLINGAEGNAAPLHSVGSNIEDPRLKEYDTLLGERILAANAAIGNTTADVRLGVGKTVVETPRKAGLGWLDALAEYSSVSADGVPQVRVPVYSLTVNRDTVIWAAPLELFSEISLSIRAASPFANTFYFGLTNGSLLYLPTKAAFAEGGYEPSVSPFTDGAEADFTSAVTQYLRQLKKELKADAAAEYWVSPSGNDASAGTQDAPWQTLGKAAAAVAPGDTVFLRAGTYRETLRAAKSGEAGKPIRFVGAPGERPVLSGADPLTGTWQPHQGSIYKLPTDLKFIQLFVDGKMMPEARWPDTPPGELMTYNRAAAGEGTGYELLADKNLPAGDWNGGIVLFWPGSRWVSMTRRIADYQPGRSLRLDPTTEQKVKDKYHQSDPYKPRAGNPYLLTGSLAGLDSPGEWFLDEKTGTVYLWTPDSKSPATHAVAVKQRDCAADFGKLHFVELKGVDILGAGVNMADAQGCVLEDCRLRYVEHVRQWEGGKLPPAGNVITGKGNEWRRCLIYGAATTGLRMAGEDNRLTDSIIHDVNYAGSGRGGLDLTQSAGAVVSHCTIFRTGRDNIQHHGSKRIRIEYCDIFHTNLLNNDSGAIYAWGTDGEGGVIAYNWVHDNLGDSTVGIYLDNFDKNFIVHHNLVWNCSGSGIRMNSDALHHLVANNTIQQVREPFGTYCYAGYTPTMKGTRVLNNLVNEAINPNDPWQFVQGELGPELSHCAPGAVDQDGYPTEGSAAIDAGIEIAGVTDGFQGRAPDLGAYEFGGPRWTAGADWKDAEAPPAPARNLAYTPHPPITEKTMITDGLAVWLDAADRTTLDASADGTVTAWRDKSAAKRVACPALPKGSVKWVADGMNGKPTVRGNGTGSLRFEEIHGQPKPLTVFVVSQSLEPRGPEWQRVMASFTGVGQEWVLPNWMIGAPGGQQPATWPPRLFLLQQRDGAALGKITVLGASAAQGQALGGDISEVLIFDRSLRFDETEAVTKYLKEKWGLK